MGILEDRREGLRSPEVTRCEGEQKQMLRTGAPLRGVRLLGTNIPLREGIQTDRAVC